MTHNSLGPPGKREGRPSPRPANAAESDNSTTKGTGHMPLLPLEVRRALWRRPADRALAELLHDACGEAIA